MNNTMTLDSIISLAKRRGFVYPSSEIYGGLANSFDYGPYGVLLKRNIENYWWKYFVETQEDIVGLDAGIFLNPKVWEASGHITGFTDALIDCKKCKRRTRADHLIEDALDKKVEGLFCKELTSIIKDNKLKCPYCGSLDLTDVRNFNLLFESKLGIVEGEKSKLYLRGELAQGIYINFKNVIDTTRVSIPFGIAQSGKAFRNEITMGQFIHRTLEFDLMEIEYFIHPNDWKTQFIKWQNVMWKFALSLGILEKNLRWREHEDHERVFYSKKTMDIEFKYPFGWKEMFGIAYRSDYDILNHAKKSGKDLRYKDPHTNKSYIPHVIEPTFGLSRLTGIILVSAYTEENINNKNRFLLKLNPKIAPIKAAVFPLQKDIKLRNLALKIYQTLKKEFSVEFDDSGNIGKMYRRQDEIGTPYCITVDFDSLQDDSITIRDRDTMLQERIPISQITSKIQKALQF